MFTGIISAVGKVLVSRDANRDTSSRNERLLEIETPYTDIELGESVAVNGACLTATETSGGKLSFYASHETCARTNLGGLTSGSLVNLERAMRLQDRVSGHLVQGHVDGQARLAACMLVGDSHELQCELPEQYLRYVIEKGSITLDGISLTINSIKNSTFSVMIIPHTWHHTQLKYRKVGDYFNVELDMIAKHLERLAQFK